MLVTAGLQQVESSHWEYEFKLNTIHGITDADFRTPRQSNKILDSCSAGCGRQALWGTTNTIRFNQNNCKSSVFCYPVTGFHTTNMAHVRPVYWSGWRICYPVANRTRRIVLTCFSLPSTAENTFWGKQVWLARSQPGDTIHNDTNVFLTPLLSTAAMLVPLTGCTEISKNTMH